MWHTTILTKSDIVTLLNCPPKNNLPHLQINDAISNGLLQLSTILNCNEVTPTILTKLVNSAGQRFESPKDKEKRQDLA